MNERIPVYRLFWLTNGKLGRSVGKVYNCTCNINLYPKAPYHAINCQSWWNYTEYPKDTRGFIKRLLKIREARYE